MKRAGLNTFGLMMLALLLALGILSGIVAADDVVAKIGETEYASLEAAVAAAEDGDTVELLSDTTVASAIKVTGKAVTITGAYTITTSEDDVFEAGKDGIISLEAGLTVNASSSVLWAHDGGVINVNGAEISCTSTKYAAAFAEGSGSEINVAGSLTKSGSDHVTISVKDGASATIVDGMVKNTDSTVLAVTGSGSVITIEGGEVASTSTTANGHVAGYARNNGKIVVNDGTIDASNWCALSALGGEIEINDGTVKKAVGAYESSSSKITINGGTVGSTGSWGVYVSAGASGEINDGTVNGYARATTNDNSTLVISGGTFTDSGIDYEIIDGYYKIDNEDGTYTVGQKQDPEVSEPEANELTYNGEEQELVSEGETDGGTLLYAMLTDPDAEPTDGDWTEEVPTAEDVGTYYVYYKVDGGDEYNDVDPVGPITVEIAKKPLADKTITIELAPSKTFEYDGEEHEITSVTVKDSETDETLVTFDTQDAELPITTDGFELAESSVLKGTNVGSYMVTVNVTGETGSGDNGNSVSKAVAVLAENYTGSARASWQIVGESSGSSSGGGLHLSRLCVDCELPATGFSAKHVMTLRTRPDGFSYDALHLRIQIPTLNADAELVDVPLEDNAWQVEWLDNQAGVLRGTSLPGEGYSVVAAHNTLNNTEYGPFALLSSLELNDTVIITTAKGEMKLFRVYANELLAPNDLEKLESIAEQEENTLVLVTCENEAVRGGYLNRRAVFAKPID